MLFDAAKEGTLASVDYEYPMPGNAVPVAKGSFVTRVATEAALPRITSKSRVTGDHNDA